MHAQHMCVDLSLIHKKSNVNCVKQPFDSWEMRTKIDTIGMERIRQKEKRAQHSLVMPHTHILTQTNIYSTSTLESKTKSRKIEEGFELVPNLYHKALLERMNKLKKETSRLKRANWNCFHFLSHFLFLSAAFFHSEERITSGFCEGKVHSLYNTHCTLTLLVQFAFSFLFSCFHSPR